MGVGYRVRETGQGYRGTSISERQKAKDEKENKGEKGMEKWER